MHSDTQNVDVTEKHSPWLRLEPQTFHTPDKRPIDQATEAAVCRESHSVTAACPRVESFRKLFYRHMLAPTPPIGDGDCKLCLIVWSVKGLGFKPQPGRMIFVVTPTFCVSE